MYSTPYSPACSNDDQRLDPAVMMALLKVNVVAYICKSDLNNRDSWTYVGYLTYPNQQWPYVAAGYSINECNSLGYQSVPQSVFRALEHPSVANNQVSLQESLMEWQPVSLVEHRLQRLHPHSVWQMSLTHDASNDWWTSEPCHCDQCSEGFHTEISEIYQECEPRSACGKCSEVDGIESDALRRVDKVWPTNTHEGAHTKRSRCPEFHTSDRIVGLQLFVNGIMGHAVLASSKASWLSTLCPII